MNIAIIKYNAGNIQSVLFALQRIGVQATVTDDVNEIKNADKIIFPGVGEASTAMDYLKTRNLDQVIKNLTQPVLGICLGMQLLCEYSVEGNTSCIGVFEKVRLNKFTAQEKVKVPQIGWNTIILQNNKLFDNITPNPFVYNVHSYYVPINEHTIATCEYTLNYSAAIQKNNFYGVQFHPEKSGTVGEQILKNFINL
jgi:imidazole glycerol-phosphate synthase subunit HisH